ncbi:MAG: 4Fe-4S binding protein, partial [Mycobacterium leprae]
MALFKLFDKARRTPLATAPFDPRTPAPEGFRGVPEVDPDRCEAHGECVSVCPADAITQNGVWQLDLTKCNLCGLCVDACPEQAI